MNAPGSERINTAFWNLQNLFDVEPSWIATDLGVTAINGWDRRALESRIISLAAAIRAMFDGSGPDLIGLAEIENERIARLLMSAIGRDDYGLVMADHPQATASGLALLYSRDVFDEQDVQSHGHLVHQRFPTCDILEVSLTVRSNLSRLTVLVNHWPSRLEDHSDAFRISAASYCSQLVRRQLTMSRREYVELSDTEVSRHQLSDRWDANLLLMGSFNDDPWAASLCEILNAGFQLQAMSESLPLPRQGLPSWRSYASHRPKLFNPAWGLLSRPDQSTVAPGIRGETPAILDQLMLSRGLAVGQSGLQAIGDALGVPRMGCLADESITDANGCAIPYSGDTYEGISDRLPVGMSFRLVPSGVAAGTEERPGETDAERSAERPQPSAD